MILKCSNKVRSHVVNSRYSYCIYIQKLKNINSERLKKVNRTLIVEYTKDLDDDLEFTYNAFAALSDNDLEELDNSKKKIFNSWGQLHDIEQLMEHTVVPLLRLRRQTEKFKTALAEKNKGRRSLTRS